MSYVTEFLLDVSDNFEFSRGGEGWSTFSEKSGKISCKVSAGEVNSLYSMRHRVTLIDWDCVCDTITRIDYTASNSTRGVE